MSGDATTGFGPDVLLVFIGHSDDARVEAHAVYELEGAIQRHLEELRGVPGATLALKVARCWEWNEDAPPMVGGQTVAIDPYLERADIAVFVFKESAGAVTWRELEQARGRDNVPSWRSSRPFHPRPPGSSTAGSLAAGRICATSTTA